MALNEDLYAVMGVSPTASAAEIDRAYKARIVKCHPDLARDPADALRRTTAAARLNAAATVLRDPDRRAVYDLDRRNATARAEATTTPARRPAPTGVSVRPASSVPPEEDDFADIFNYVPTPSRRRSIRQPREWLFYDRFGQWVALIAIIILAAGASPMFTSTSGDQPRFVAAVAVGWLLLGALLTRNIENPAGDLFRLLARIGEWLIGRFIAAGRATGR